MHRLLTENSIDELMLAALADKSALFAEYVRKSALRDASASAADGTHADVDSPFDGSSLEQQILKWERRRLIEPGGGASPARTESS